MKRLLVLTPFTLLALAAPAFAGGGGCHSGEPSAIGAATTISVEHACFGPEAARVAVGSTITWLNASDLPHNISGPAIEYVDLPIGGKATHRFTKAGIYPYACMLHPGMSGVVVVGDVALTGAAPAADVAAPPVQPVANATDDGGTSYVPWVVAAVVILVASGAVLTFSRREGRLAHA